jgi:hypothetical protein
MREVEKTVGSRFEFRGVVFPEQKGYTFLSLCHATPANHRMLGAHHIARTRAAARVRNGGPKHHQ